MQYAITKLYKPKVYLEIGVHNGGSMSYVLYNNHEVEMAIGIDLFEETYGHYKKDHLTFERTLRNIQNSSTSDNVSINMIKGNSQDESVVLELKNYLSDRDVDLLFIDGDHTYEGVSSDYYTYEKFLKPGGILVFDDYHERWSGVKKFVDEISSDDNSYEKVGVFFNNEMVLKKIVPS